MRIFSINSTTPKFKGIREDRNTTSQLKENNTYSLTEPNQRRINKAIENLAQQRGEENIKFLLNVGENLTYQTRINDKPTKNDWRSKLKQATKSSLAISDPILKEKYEPEIFRVFDEPKPLSEDEEKVLMHRDSIMYRADLKSLEKNSNPNIKNLERNMDYFIASSETPIKQKAYVMERLDYMMSPHYNINPQLEDKKTQVLAEIMNDMVINTPESNVPNIKAVNQKTHGMCAAISIARKAVAYEDKPNYVDMLLSELDDSNNVMVYDRHNLGSGKRVPVEKTYVDFDYAQEKGYRIIDASTLQWMGIAGMYGNKNEKLSDFVAFDKQNFDAFHDSFFIKTIKDKEFSSKHNYFQALVKAKDEIGNAKAKKVRKGVDETSSRNAHEQNLKLISKYTDNTKDVIKSIVPNISKAELKEDIAVVQSLYNPTSEKIKKQDEKLRKYSYIPNEEDSQKSKKVKAYFVDKYADRVSEKNLDKNIETVVENVSTLHSLDRALSNSTPLSGKIANARGLYNAEATYRASILMGLMDEDTATDYLVHYNIPDKESRISQGYQTIIDRIDKKDDKQLQDFFAFRLGMEADDKEGVLDSLNQIKASVDYIQTDGLDTLYSLMGIGDRRSVLLAEITNTRAAVEQGDKDQLSRMATTMNVKNDKKHVIAELNKLEKSIVENPEDEKIYKTALNKMGSKDEMRNFMDVYGMFMERIQNDEDGSPYIESFKKVNGIEGATREEMYATINTNISDVFNSFAQSMANAENLLEINNADGTRHFSVSDSQVVMKKMENEGKLIPAKTMLKFQERFNKIDKIRSSDEFASRQGKISDPELYKLSAPEKEAVKKIDNKLNTMYSDTVKEHTRIFREIRKPLEKHARHIGTNSGNYWVREDGSSGLCSPQEVKIFEQMTDKAYYANDDVENALGKIKNSAHSGVSSTSVFSHAHGWHAQYIADVTEVGKDGKTVMFHDNTWGASEHENTWVDSEGLTRTDYSDRRGGDLGYITNDDWRNGNYVENLTRKSGHISPDNVESRVYRKIKPAGSESDFSTVSDVIMPGKSPAYKEIAAQIKDTLFLPESVFLPDIKKLANGMTSKEIQKAIFKNESLGVEYKDKFAKIEKRIKGDAMHKSITTLEDYNKLSDSDPVKITFEKAAIRLAYPDAPMYDELGSALDMKSAMKVKAEQKRRAVDNFDYAFGKTTDVMAYLAQEQSRGMATLVIDALKDNSLPLEKASDILANVCVLAGYEDKFTGSTKDTINLILDKTSKQYDDAMDTSFASKKAKKEIMTGMKDLLTNALYFNKDDMNFESDKAKGIENWIDEKFNPTTDEEFIQIYNTLQDMPKADFVKLREGVTDKQLGMTGITGFDVLEKFNAANDEAETTVRNILFNEEYSKDMDRSKTKTRYKFSKLNKKTRGATYQGKRTFDDLYRSMCFSLSTLTYEKMFNKWKDRNFREYGAIPAYPVLDLSNNKGITGQVESMYEIIGSSMADIIQKKTVQRNYKIIDELNNYTKQLNSDKHLTEPQRKHIQNLAGEFITLNMNDTSVNNSLVAAYNLLGMEKGTNYNEMKPHVDAMVKEFAIIQKANESVNLDDYINNLRNGINNYNNTIIDINIPPRFQKKVKEAAYKWQNLEMKYAMGDKIESENMQLLQAKIDKHSITPQSEKQINSFNKIVELATKTRILKDKKKLDKSQLAEREQTLAEMTEKYVSKYIKESARDNIKANINDWTHKEVRGGNRRKITADDVIDARDKFEQDFYKYHITKHPIDLLNTFLLLSSKDAQEHYPKSVESAKAYEGMLQSELTLTRFTEIQDALMEAVQTGNTAHVKEYFDDYYIDADNQVSMNSDESIDYMIRYLLLDDNTKTAKMFVEKLGLGDRVMKIESDVIEKSEPKKQIDMVAKELKKIGMFQTTVNDEFANLLNNIDDAEDTDAAIDTVKQNILKRLYKKAKNPELVKAYMAAMDDAKTTLKENPEMPRNIILENIHSTVVNEIQGVISADLSEKQECLNQIHAMYKFLLDLRLPEYSDGYKMQQQMQKDYAELLNYNNTVLTNAAQNNDSIKVKMKDA